MIIEFNDVQAITGVSPACAGKLARQAMEDIRVNHIVVRSDDGQELHLELVREEGSTP